MLPRYIYGVVSHYRKRTLQRLDMLVCGEQEIRDSGRPLGHGSGGHYWRGYRALDGASSEGTKTFWHLG